MGLIKTMMKGHVPTPRHIAAEMVSTIFNDNPPQKDDRILFPGVGSGPFVEEVLLYCDKENCRVPEGIGVDTNPQHIASIREKFAESPFRFDNQDFLDMDYDPGKFDYIMGNPPYVHIDEIDDSEALREQYDTAIGRFDLYFLFFEKSLDLLTNGGNLIFITPEKYEYVGCASVLREKLAKYNIKSINHLPSDTFPDHTSYPTITHLSCESKGVTTITTQSANEFNVQLPITGESWASNVRSGETNLQETGTKLKDITKRISPGMATGADNLFIQARDEALREIRDEWAHPTVSGREIAGLPKRDYPTRDSTTWSSIMICPYDDEGNLRPLEEAFKKWAEHHRDKLKARSCYQKYGKEWYAWHENPPMTDLKNWKIIFPDITSEPVFRIDWSKEVIPAHSVYYLIPKEGVDIVALREYLNSTIVREWFEKHCQKAANSYLRLQTNTVKNLPIPDDPDLRPTQPEHQPIKAKHS